MKNVDAVVDGFLLSVGSVYSLANIKETLGIIILILQLSWILVKLITKIVTKIKSGGSIDDIDNDFNEFIDKFEDLAEAVDEEVNNNGENS